jgi:soluble lytic murein transglycosylase-like protein
MPQIIDELIVLFKLDGSQAKKQAEAATQSTQKVVKTAKISAEDQERIARSQEQRAKERDQRQEKVRKQRERDRKKALDQRTRQAEEFGDKIKGVGLAISGAFLGFESIKGAINVFNSITTATAALGRKSENLGQSAQDLQTWELAVKKAGGEAEDADKAFSTLSQTFTGALLQGKDSPFLQLLMSMGVAARDAKGQIKPLGDVLTELGDKMQARGLRRADAFNLFTQAGGTEGIFNLLYDPRRTQFLAESRTAANVDAQKISDSQRFKASTAKVKENIGAVLSNIQGAIVHELAIASENTGFKRGSVGDKLIRKKQFAPTISATEQKYGLPAGQLEKLINQESGFQPDARNKKSGALGIAQLNPRFFPNAGKDPYADIDTAGKELARLRDYYKGDLGLAVAAYNDGQGNIAKVLSGKKQLPEETRQYTKNVYGATPSVLTGAGGNVTGDTDHSVTVTTGPVTIQTNATDANGIATDFMGAMRAKGSLVAQSNYGVTP